MTNIIELVGWKQFLITLFSLLGVVFAIVIGLGEFLNYLSSQNLLDDSIRDNIGGILLGMFSQ